MGTALSVENLATFSVRSARRVDGLSLLLAVEAWLDARAGRRAIRGLGDRALADLALSRADAERIAHTLGA